MNEATAESVAQMEMKTIITDMPLEGWTARLAFAVVSALGSKYYHKFPLRNVLQKRQDVSCTF